ncbi:MAG: thioredoxin reductase [Candidatus Diapherotrites archaeon CG11_big_fil_rev_8_21_14_0_20_37_9]|nr:MAG: thioredoxin reductase [Candidatus Diapherotrites archaeon CG11_big_fil_rev_8_21_14_0_20_37_9]
MDKYDLIIIGAGSAGLPAAVYAARFRLKTIVIGDLIGGTITKTHVVENWPGIVEISGLDLASKLEEHVRANDVEILPEKVIDVTKSSNGFSVKTNSKEFFAKTVLFATGTTRKKLGVPGEKEFENKGVSYCAVCDAALFRNKVVAVVGGSDSAAKEALLLAEYAKKVYLIHRRDKIRPEPINGERVKNNLKIELLLNLNVKEIFGEKLVKGVRFVEGGELLLDGVFIEIGAIPNSGLAEKLGEKITAGKETMIDKDSRTNVPGIYAAGDIADRHFKQAITGAAEGVIAAFSAYEYINKSV